MKDRGYKAEQRPDRPTRHLQDGKSGSPKKRQSATPEAECAAELLGGCAGLVVQSVIAVRPEHQIVLRRQRGQAIYTSAQVHIRREHQDREGRRECGPVG